MAFERRFTDAGIEKLREEPLFRNCLLPDIEGKNLKKRNGQGVFPAVRKNRMDFYYKGGKLFSYGRSKFTTHLKYASVIKKDGGSQYVTDANLQAISSFEEGYERIKENCSLYSGIEAQGLSRVYSNFSCARRKRSENVVVLDIEVSLNRGVEAEEVEPGKASLGNSDRIDLLLFDTKSGMLRFFEAKDFSNGEIRAIPGNEPRIVKQMNRYEKQLITDNVRSEMLESYAVHVEIINELFGPEEPLPVPQDIDPVPRLLLFGFDLEQLTGKLRREVSRLEQEYSLSVYAIGDIKKANPRALFSGGKKHW